MLIKEMNTDFLKRNKWLILGFVVCLVVLVLLVGYFDRTSGPARPPVNSNEVPPVVVTVPQLKLLETIPAEGIREDVDTYSQTRFTFSAPIVLTSATVTTSPSISVQKFVHGATPDTLVVEAGTMPWVTGVEYKITINKGLRGVNGEELQNDVVYKFTNNPPEVIDYEGSDQPIDWSKIKL